MPKPTAPELAILRQDPVYIERHISICPRTKVFEGVVDLSGSLTHLDAYTNGRWAIRYTSTLFGGFASVKEGMTLDVGTTRGARDVGSVRVRKDAIINTIYINETAVGS